jgi:creatinine amidohydrolase/Fe(II)-dependent formamide hydrolase-like protein
VDFHLPRTDGEVRHVGCLPADSPGSIGDATLATAEKGERIYAHIVQKIRAKVLLAAPDDEP